MNDLDLSKEGWKEASEGIWTESLWIVDSRDNSGGHHGGYHGNFISQIPRQLMRRYTRQGDLVLDPFLGSGTTAIEAKRLGRHCVGIELLDPVLGEAEAAWHREPAGPIETRALFALGDATQTDYAALCQQVGSEHVQLAILHPPYHDIIRFSEDPRDLSNQEGVPAFLTAIRAVVAGVDRVLAEEGTLAIICGDKYAGGEWVPLATRVMDVALEAGYTLKSIVVKNMAETRGKRGQKSLWRYRALKGGYYVFAHEYLYIFQKPRAKPKRGEKRR